MKKIAFFFALIASSNLNAGTLYDICLDCSKPQVLAQASIHMARYQCEAGAPNCSSEESAFYSDMIHIYTDTNRDKGYSILGAAFNNTLNVRIVAPFQAGLDYFSAMSDVKNAYSNMIENVQKDLDNQFLVDHGFSKSELLPSHSSTGGEPTGECNSNSDASSPFDYFTGNSRLTLNAEMEQRIQGFKPGVDIAIDQLGLVMGRNPGVQVGILISQSQEGITATYQNSGQLAFNVVSDGFGGYATQLNLAASHLGNGLTIYDNYSPGQGPRMSDFIYQNPDGSYTVVQRQYSFDNTCLEQDFEELLNSLNFEFNLEGIPLGDPGLGRGSCGAFTQTSHQYQWTEFVQTMTVRNNVVTVVGEFVTRYLNIVGHTVPC